MDMFIQLSGTAHRTINMRHVITLGTQEEKHEGTTVYYVAILLVGETKVYGEPRATSEEAEFDLHLILESVNYAKAYLED
jgi:hypothetical protein